MQFKQRFARGNHGKRNQGINKLELEYQRYLETLKMAGEVLWHEFERIKLKLANNTFYTPDFMVMMADGTLEIHEVKGFWEDDARVKIKVAADQFPFIFRAIKKAPKKEGGGWLIESF